MKVSGKETITVESTRFGRLSIASEEVLVMPKGMFGFPDARRFAVLEHTPPFFWLHSLDDPGLAFVVVDGAEFSDFFKVKLPYGDDTINLSKDDEFSVLVLITLGSDTLKATANLAAPLVFNLRNRLGLQIVLEDPRYSTAHPLVGDKK